MFKLCGIEDRERTTLDLTLIHHCRVQLARLFVLRGNSKYFAILLKRRIFTIKCFLSKIVIENPRTRNRKIRNHSSSWREDVKCYLRAGSWSEERRGWGFLRRCYFWRVSVVMYSFIALVFKYSFYKIHTIQSRYFVNC